MPSRSPPAYVGHLGSKVSPCGRKPISEGNVRHVSPRAQAVQPLTPCLFDIASCTPLFIPPNNQNAALPASRRSDGIASGILICAASQLTPAWWTLRAAGSVCCRAGGCLSQAPDSVVLPLFDESPLLSCVRARLALLGYARRADPSAPSDTFGCASRTPPATAGGLWGLLCEHPRLPSLRVLRRWQGSVMNSGAALGS